MKRKFWMVYNPIKGVPRVEHESFQEAYDEASRLCRKEGDKFAILEVVGYVQSSHPPVEYTEVRRS